ncbi:flagellar M-ring protein FliF [Rhodobacteraceae bacterium 2CG4]|uniref:Flagellar M-ring protein n=1 Tax=Halovulum marinum TaxID=2662447 RepID=A0A6L5Z6P6_9RHOB|nr:flagellar basal-body MS-ring/collar protein FliF [Halovulum marinum]MSU91780.1 flagellar M-ring protein FliF [Halovulum marinum]
MNQILSGWAALDSRRKMIVALAALAMVISFATILRLASSNDMALLYAGLEPATAGEVVAALEASGTAFEVRGGSIYVDASVRDSTRLSLAAEGLPAAGGVGYELLDSMSGFGTTAQMFDAAYWRAKEGELARTILASRDIRAARVHLATPPQQPFARPQPVTASVTVTPARGAVDTAQAQAIRYLVSSAVAGLAGADVAVIDSVNGVVLAGEGGSDSGADPAAADPRAAQMKANLERLLSARVGPGKARVEVNIDADMDSQTITERVIDPTSRVAISSDLEEVSESAEGNAGGAVTVASNLPAGDAAKDGAGTQSNRSETRERQNFEVSETRRERIIQPGQIRRISVAVMVDGITTVDGDGGRSWAPRPEEEMAALRELVESAVGFDPARGDRISLQTLEFPAAPDRGTTAGAPAFSLLDGSVLGLVQTAVLGIVVLLLGIFVVRPLLSRPAALPAPAEADLPALGAAASAAEAIASAAPAALPTPEHTRIGKLRDLMTDRRDESADILRRWIEAPEQPEGYSR